MQTLDRLSLAENTLLVVCSDNGPVLDDGYKDDAVEKLGPHLPAGPYRGGKYSVFEGGTRTPFITRWKGRITPGVSDQVVCTIDLPASLAALTGQPLPDDACLDSFNVLGALLGDPQAPGRDHLLQQDNGSGSFGFREGTWKLVRQAAKKPARAAGKQAAAPDQLFDLSKDAGETTNVAGNNPEVLARLQTRLDEVIKNGRSR
jgi:arylsulfatase A